MGLDVEFEEHDVAVLDEVVLAFDAELAGFFNFGFGAVGEEVLAVVDLGFDEAALKVGVDNAGGLGGLAARFEGPSAVLVGTSGEEGAKTEGGVGFAD